MTPIPQEWIRRYVDHLLEFANKCENKSNPMAVAAMLRADHIMDLVNAWCEDDKPPPRPEPSVPFKKG